MNDTNLKLHLRQCIQKVATGPEYSKDLTYDEAYYAMRHLLDPEVDPVQAAIYLIALRMKRETDEENRGTLQALIDTAEIRIAKVAEIIDLSDPYDGYARGVPASSFAPAVFAALGIPTVLHGLKQVGPKYGATHHLILKAAGLSVDLTPDQAQQQLEKIGWTYIDQAQFAPQLYALVPLRQRMIKRQVLTTVETLLAPIRGSEKTHYISGYVHQAYPPIYAALAKQAGFASAAFIRGVEGGVIPSLQQAGKLFYYRNPDEALQQLNIDPQTIGIEATTRAIPLPENLPAAPMISDEIASMVDSAALAQSSAKQGLAALAGERGLMYDSLVYVCAIGLLHLQHYETLLEAANAVRVVLDSGKALKLFRAAA
ncbi:anthranilate phosphoribosyltransferase [Thiolinea disciformis]|uniref:anthranilate phosphoribosyltransferase n=1 Tax=Thiolinea disciformis TaxID=125614 RepID=UPI000377FECB|nr:hypothetical protein [Thiolinea disciformis]